MNELDLIRRILTPSNETTTSAPTSGVFETTTSAPTSGVFAGRYCIIRCRDAGVHAGFVVSHSGREATLSNSRRLWYWKVPEGKPAFLSGVAQHGIVSESKVGCPIDVHLTEVCEIIPCSTDAEKSIKAQASHSREQ